MGSLNQIFKNKTYLQYSSDIMELSKEKDQNKENVNIKVGLVAFNDKMTKKLQKQLINM